MRSPSIFAPVEQSVEWLGQEVGVDLVGVEVELAEEDPG
jgi:hypothetical protein